MISFLRQRALLRSISGAMVGLFLNGMVVFPSWADAIDEGAAKGREVGEEMRAMLQNALPQQSSSGEALPGNNLNVELKELFPGSNVGSSNDYQNVFGNDADIMNAGFNANSTLSTENSMPGEAYRVLKKGRQQPNMKNDPIITKSTEVTNNLDVFEKEFVDCSAETTFLESTRTARLPEYRTCERVKRADGDHVLFHDYAFVPPIEPAAGDAVASSCGPGCLTINIGKIGDNYLSGNCSVHEMVGNLRIRNPEKIQSVVLEYVKWDDHVQVYIGQNKIFQGPNAAQFPPETAGKCELETEWERTPNVDVTHLFQAAGTIPFKVRVSVTDKGEAFARLRVHYDPNLEPAVDEWGDEKAVEAARGLADGFCEAPALTCTDMPAVDAEGCATIDGIRICPSDLSPSPHPDISPLCRKAEFNADCGFNEGPLGCYTDAQGNEICPVNGGETCGINHHMVLSEESVSASVAGAGIFVGTFRFDLAHGTWKEIAPSDGVAFDGQVGKVSYDDICTGRAKSSLHYVGQEWWSGFNFGGVPDTTVIHTILQHPTCENGLVGVVQIRDTGSNPSWNGLALATTLRYKVLTVRSDSWGHSTCIEAAQSVAQGQCANGSITVTQGPSTPGGCGTISGINVCPGDPFYNLLAPSPIPGVDRLVQQVRVDGCVKQPTNNNTCETLEQDPNCGFISSSCIEGAEGASGTCYATEEKWDCGQDVAVPKIEANKTYSCGGAIRCLGEECATQGKDQGDDFAEAMVALQVAQFAGTDLDCGQNEGDGTGASSPSMCTIFEGEPMECKRALGGWVDCCDQPAGVSLGDYVDLTLNSMKAMEAVSNLEMMQPITGAWSNLTQPIANSWDKVTSAVSSAADSATGSATEQMADFAVGEVIDEFKQKLMQEAYEWTVQTFGEAAGGALFATETATTTNAAGTSTTSTTATGLSSAVTSAMSVIMWVYTVYVIVDMLVNIIYECEEQEFALASKKEIRVCHQVGSYCASSGFGGCTEKRESYCCFNSPVARIIQEQVRPQLGMSWGTAEEPDCSGIKVGDFEKVDWAQVDLSEWMAILRITDNFPTAEKMNLENLTGTGSALNVDGARLDSAERAADKLNGVDAADIRQEVQGGM